jgi:hypothetical protein
MGIIIFPPCSDFPTFHRPFKGDWCFYGSKGALRTPCGTIQKKAPQLNGFPAIIGRLGEYNYCPSVWLLSPNQLEMTDRATLDNTLGAAFLGASATCLWVPYDGFSKHLRGITLFDQSLRNYHRSNAVILPELFKRLDCPKDLGTCWSKLQSITFSWCLYSAPGGNPRVRTVLQGSWVYWPSHPSRTLATFNLIFTLHSSYIYLIVNFGIPQGLESIVWYVCSVSDTTMNGDASSCE